MNSHIYNLQERTECNKVEPKLRLWVINYEITDIAKGAALVKASNAKEASNMLLADSQFNAYRRIFNIIRIEEILTDGMDANLAMEEWIRFSDIPNLDASKIIYIPSNGMNSRNVQGAIDELNTNIKKVSIQQGTQGPKGDKGDKMAYDDLTEEEKNDLASRVPAPEIPEELLSEYAKKSEVPTKTSELENDAQYVTQEDVQGKISSETLTAIEPISEVEYNSKLADGTLSSTIMYVIL